MAAQMTLEDMHEQRKDFAKKSAERYEVEARDIASLTKDKAKGKTAKNQLNDDDDRDR